MGAPVTKSKITLIQIQILVAYPDMSKTCDKVWHKVLISELKSLWYTQKTIISSNLTIKTLEKK